MKTAVHVCYANLVFENEIDYVYCKKLLYWCW